MISYGMYLWHVSLVKILVGSDVPPASRSGLGWAIAVFLAAVAGAVVLGAASWYLVERPAQRLFRRARPGAPVVADPEAALTHP
jgi:peptidoglycan/LPS O-acetylase OafA/YrhL